MVGSFSVTPDCSKASLRRHLLQVRRSMAVEDWQRQSRQLCEQLLRSPLWSRSHTILAYFSTRQEPDLAALFTLPKVWGFPRCVGSELVWHEWSAATNCPLQPGAFGISEPYPDAPQIEVNQADLILVPAIACDAQGYRLGYGGGFYDRLLSSPQWAQIPTIGITFDFARLPQLPRDPWDQPLQAVCTELGWFAVEGADG